MSLTNCPTCNHSVSVLAEACPQCGHPISARRSNQVASSGGLFSAFAAISFVLFVIACGIAVATKPTETELKNSVLAKYGMVYGAGVIGEKLGVLSFTYQDRVVYSTLSVNVISQPEKVIAYGLFGKVLIPELISPNVGKSEETPRAGPQQSSIPDQVAPSRAPNQTETSLGPEEIRNGLRTVYPLMRDEMLAAAIAAARQKHPASNFVGNGCDQKALTTEAYQEVRWTYYGTYQCQMKGAILGITQFNFEVKVEGQVKLNNGTFVRSIVRASAN